MARLRGAPVHRPVGAEGWPLLNERLFGSHAAGGQHCPFQPGALPWSWAETFEGEGPLCLEIGFNRGHFLTQLAQRWPHARIVGIEIRQKFAWRLTHLIAKDDEGPRNVRLLWADARQTVPEIFAPQSVQHIFINFPDPWWKARHAKRRLVSEDFAQILYRVLAPGGRIWVKSDVQAIADEIEESLAACPGLSPKLPFGEADLPPTYRELRCLREGLPIIRYWVERAEGEP